MRKFYQIARRGFCSSYHHNFVPREELIRPNNIVSIFDFARVMLYAFLAGAFLVQLPGYFLFRRKNFRNNPDYLLADRETFMNVRKI
jgi:hypothetical protein